MYRYFFFLVISIFLAACTRQERRRAPLPAGNEYVNPAGETPYQSANPNTNQPYSVDPRGTNHIQKKVIIVESGGSQHNSDNESGDNEIHRSYAGEIKPLPEIKTPRYILNRTVRSPDNETSSQKSKLNEDPNEVAPTRRKDPVTENTGEQPEIVTREANASRPGEPFALPEKKADPKPVEAITQTLKIYQDAKSPRTTLTYIYAKSAANFSKPTQFAELDAFESRSFTLPQNDTYKIYALDKETSLVLDVKTFSEKDLGAPVNYTVPNVCTTITQIQQALTAQASSAPTFDQPSILKAATVEEIQKIYAACGIVTTETDMDEDKAIKVTASLQDGGLILKLDKKTGDIPEQEELIAYLYREVDSETPVLKSVETCRLSLQPCAPMIITALDSKSELYIVGQDTKILYKQFPINPFDGLKGPLVVPTSASLKTKNTPPGFFEINVPNKQTLEKKEIKPQEFKRRLDRVPT